MNVFSKTMPWLISASAVLTLSFSANVSTQAKSVNPVAQIKQARNSQLNLPAFNLPNLRMLNLNSQIRSATNWGSDTLLPTSDGALDSNINAYKSYPDNSGPILSYSISYSKGSPKPFNDPSLDQNDYFERLNVYWLATARSNQSNVGYQPAEDIQKSPHYIPGQVDLGNGVKAYKLLDNSRGGIYNHSLIFYQGKYEIKVTDPSQDMDGWDSVTKLAKADLWTIKFSHLPNSDSYDDDRNGSYGLVDVNSRANKANIVWQNGELVYHSDAKDLKTNLAMANSLKKG